MPEIQLSKRKTGPGRPSDRNLEIYKAVVLNGETQTAIGERYGMSRARVSQICERVDDWQAAQIKAERLRARATVQHQHLYAEAMEEWRRSKTEPATTVKSVEADGTAGKPGDSRTETTTASKCGDPRYLGEAAKNVAAIRELWGLDAKRTDETGSVLNQINLLIANATPEQLAQMASGVLALPAEPTVIDSELAD